MYNRITKKKPKQQSIRHMLTWLMLVLYLVASSSLEHIDSFGHDHEALVSHSNEQEKDPCHRLIYHNDIEEGCGHNAHLTISNKCQMCDIASIGAQALLRTAAFKCKKVVREEFFIFQQNLDSYYAVISSSRAPPVLI